jgi:hypothetical protein
MRADYLERWRANALAEALWATEQPGSRYRPWQALTARPSNTNPQPRLIVRQAAWRQSDYVETGNLTLYERPAHVPGPRYLPVKVPPLLELDISPHIIAVTYHDYERLMHRLAIEHPALFKAWVDYVRKPRLSAIFHLDRSRAKGKLYARVKRSKHYPEALAFAALAILHHAQVVVSATSFEDILEQVV